MIEFHYVGEKKKKIYRKETKTHGGLMSQLPPDNIQVLS